MITGIGDRILMRSSGITLSETPLITEWNITSGDTITLPFVSGYTYNCYVEWGDDTITSVDTYNATGATHTYSSTGTFQIKVHGKCGAWSVNNNYSVDTKITGVISWGDIGLDYIDHGFDGCTNLTSLPTGSITGMNSLTSIINMFENTGITSIPTGLLDNMTLLQDLTDLFLDCSSITSIPTDLFRYNTQVTSFAGTFDNTGITSIPTDLFRYNTQVTTFAVTFRDTGITSIPTDLFRYNTQVTNFLYTFQNTGITSIPTDLFRYNTEVTTFRWCFRYCSSLTTMPSGLFYYNTKVTEAGYYGMFESSGITFVESYFFPPYGTMLGDNYDFSYMFRGCSDLTGISQVGQNWFWSTFYNKTVNAFDYAFYQCTGITGDLPDVWRFADNYWTGYSTGGCFSFCTNAANYADVPTAWGGN